MDALCLFQLSNSGQTPADVTLLFTWAVSSAFYTALHISIYYIESLITMIILDESLMTYEIFGFSQMIQTTFAFCSLTCSVFHFPILIMILYQVEGGGIVSV